MTGAACLVFILLFNSGVAGMNERLMQLMSYNEVRGVVTKLKRGKTSGSDGLPQSFMSYFGR